jgi:hypothetical protein
MAYITTYHSILVRYQAISRSDGVVAGVIDRVNRKDPHWYCDCEAKSPFNIPAYRHPDVDSLSPPPKYSQYQFESLFPPSPAPDLYSTRWRLKADPTIHRSPDAVPNVSPSVGREPAPWCPASDPIVETPRSVRTMGIAPGTTWVKPVTVMDKLDNITAGKFPPLRPIDRSCPAKALDTISLNTSGEFGFEGRILVRHNVGHSLSNIEVEI